MLAKVTAQTQSVIISIRKGTWQRNARQQEEEGKNRDQKGPNWAGHAHQAQEDTLNNVSYIACNNSY